MNVLESVSRFLIIKPPASVAASFARVRDVAFSCVCTFSWALVCKSVLYELVGVGTKQQHQQQQQMQFYRMFVSCMRTFCLPTENTLCVHVNWINILILGLT